VGRITGIGRVDGPEVVFRIRAPERISGPTRLDVREPTRSFAEVMERQQRGLGFAEPLPTPFRDRPPLPPAPDDGEPLLPPALPPARESFFSLLMLKLQDRDRDG
jgi:hypothetical protein